MMLNCHKTAQFERFKNGFGQGKPHKSRLIFDFLVIFLLIFKPYSHFCSKFGSSMSVSPHNLYESHYGYILACSVYSYFWLACEGGLYNCSYCG